MATEKAAAGAAAASAAEAPSLLDKVVAMTRPKTNDEANRSKSYLKEFLDQAVKPGQVVSKDVEQNIKYWVMEIDTFEALLPDIGRDPPSSRLSSVSKGLKWRTRLHYLVHHQSETGESNADQGILNVVP